MAAENQHRLAVAVDEDLASMRPRRMAAENVPGLGSTIAWAKELQ